MYEIREVRARQILDSRGNPTVEVDVRTSKGFGRAAVPSGASTGSYEAVELRDKGKSYGGKSVLNAVENVNKVIAPKLMGHAATDQKDIDALMAELDGTDNKGKLGANAILGVSMAVAKAAADAGKVPLYKYLSETMQFSMPVPFMNVINGGKHAGNSLDIQEYMIAPIGAKSFSEAVMMCSEVYHSLKLMLKMMYGPPATNVGDEGGFAPPISDYAEPLNIMLKAVEQCGYGGKVKLALDAASSEFFSKGKYTISGKPYSGPELVDFYTSLCKEYPIISLEDPFSEDDWGGFSSITKKLAGKVAIVGDDLFVTNPSRLQKGIGKGAANSLLLKVNQIGTVTEAKDAAKLAFGSKYSVMVSHRSGETEDTFISDLAVGIGADRIKSGAPARGERTAKYNQLLRIEESLGKSQYGLKL
ncbi:MAG: phosphopyruvate hydratase [archaeon]